MALKLAELETHGGPAAVEHAALSLSDVAGMFAELYADSSGSPVDDVLEEAAALTDSDEQDTGYAWRLTGDVHLESTDQFLRARVYKGIRRRV